MDSAEASMEVVASSGTTRAAASATAGAAAATAAERQLAQAMASQRRCAALLVGSLCLTIVGQFAVFESAVFVSTVCFTPGVLCWHDVQVLLSPPNPQHQKGGESTTFDTRRGGYAQPASLRQARAWPLCRRNRERSDLLEKDVR